MNQIKVTGRPTLVLEVEGKPWKSFSENSWESGKNYFIIRGKLPAG